ncbi:RNA polymerase sigma factor [Dyadobacter aurulentus]|uniref:RNA polymerase sigma factor n=1 Tax=Dyadobacter sp. UC 10 TaxID=2605428 RepID=UPI001788DD56|nr:sigma-70 family RNA polymerase sigma factor [Dyadobacter sp. UC 10]
MQIGDKQAFEILFRRYYPSLLDFLRILRAEREAAEDILQDLFVEIWLKRDELTIHSSFKAYLYTAAKNRFFNYQKTITLSSVDVAEMIGAPLSFDPAGQLVAAEMTTAFNREMDALPAQAREAFNLQLAGARQREIALEMGISESTVEKHLGNARRKLKAAMTGYLD